MKTHRYSIVLAALVILGAQSAFAMRDSEHRFRRETNVETPPEIVKWVGEVRDEPTSHTTRHEHDMTFVRKDTGDSYGIVESPELVKLHHETEKNFMVEIEAEKTPRFLFWGGNLIVKNFRVLSELGEAIPHREPATIVVRHNAGERRVK